MIFLLVTKLIVVFRSYYTL